MNPSSDEALNAVWAAYDALPEKHKRAIVKQTAKTNPKIFRYWTRSAGLPRGYDQRKVVGREGTYGIKLDKALKKTRKGGLAADVFVLYLTQSGLLNDIPPDASGDDFVLRVEDKAAPIGSEYARFAKAFLECYPPYQNQTEDPPTTTDDEMIVIISRLDEHAAKFEGWASSLRLVGSISGDDVSAAIEAANADVSRLSDLMREHRDATGYPEIEFTTPEDVITHARELSEAMSASDEIEDFLRSLAVALRTLNVRHRSKVERTRLSTLRDHAATEVEVGAEKQKWVHRTDRDGAEWLRWAFEVDDEELTTTQCELKEVGYDHLAEFIGVGETKWIPADITTRDGEPNATVSESLKPGEFRGEEAPEAKPEEAELLKVEPIDLEVPSSVAEKDASPLAVGTQVISPMPSVEKSKKEEKRPPVASVKGAESDQPNEDGQREFDTDEKVAGAQMFTRHREGTHEPTIKETASDAVQNTHLSDTDHQAFLVETSIPDSSEEVVSVTREEDSGSTTVLAAKLAADGEYALAYHLMLNAAYLNDMTGRIPAWVFGAVACGSSMQATDQSAIATLQEFFQKYRENIFDELAGPDRTATRLLLAGSALEPALFFPITGAVSVLQTLHLHRIPAFQELVDGVSEYGARGVGLPRAALYSAVSADDLLRKQEAVQVRAKEWLVDRAPQFEIISRPGKDTWRSWISKTGPVGMLLGPVVAGRTDSVTELKALAEKYRSDGGIDQECRRLYRNILNHRGELLRPALDMIRRHTTEAIDIVNEWIAVLESQPDGRQRYDQQMLTQLRRCFTDNAKNATAELEELRLDSCPAAIRAGAEACLRVIDTIDRVLEGQGTDSIGVNARSAQRLLNDDLLRVVDLKLDEHGYPRPASYTSQADPEEARERLSKEVVKLISEAAENGLPTLAEAAKVRGELGDHEATAEIVKILECVESSEVAKHAEHERTQSIGRHKEAAQKRLNHAQRALSDALTKGLFDTEEYDRWAVRLESAERDMRSSGFVKFWDVYNACDRLTHELSKRKTREISRLRKEVERLSPNGVQKSRLEIVLGAGDVHTATDYMFRIRNQIELPEETELSPFTTFFGKGEDSACELLERELTEATGMGAFIGRVANREDIAGLNLKEMQATQAQEAAEFLRLWFKVKGDRQLSEERGASIFSFFGMYTRNMSKARVTRGSGSRSDVWELQVDTLASRDVCPLSGFGSGAHGTYRVVGYWRRPAAEDILQHARELGGGPVIVLYFGRMSSQERRSLASEQGRGDVIVIDDVLAIFVAGQRKGRLRALFLCALPFAHISPYTKAASLLPPEMFYGRHREIQQLMSAGTDSSCLLYGGRQIGKTVLLRHVQRLFESNQSGNQVATYIDLKGKEIGTNRSMDEVWLVIAEELEQKKVINGTIGPQVKHDWLFGRIEEWLSGDANRRVLILLDEADDFLAADAKGHNGKAPFSACSVLKDLMERTNRRFKLVFAGLHNVQKSTKVSNNPLAHFGEPICIGAMTAAGESREAEALITGPLAAAGYFFESADLPARILAQTNYYPNLIQIYCDELLKYMQRRSRVLFPPEKVATPPYIIVAKTLEDVYEQHELREELRLRFKWTLELDRRFELIANILALNDVDCTKGLIVEEIRENAQLYWENGFCGKDSIPLTYETFRDLLEEMVGLGILRRAEPPDHYTLRNPNVLNLIGSRDAVSRLLDDAVNWPPADIYDPTNFRGQICEKDKALRSPLNAAQEAKLKSGSNQVYVICGCAAGHVEKVEDAISYRFGRDGFVRILKGHEDLSDFQAEISRLGKRKTGGTTVVVVPDNVLWDRNWIVQATKRVGRFTKIRGAVCIVFVAGPSQLLSLVPDIVRKKYESVNFITVEPWDDSTVNQWLQEVGHTALDATGRKCLAEITGNWPGLLAEAVSFAKGNADNVDRLREKLTAEIFRRDRKQELLELFGLSGTVVAPLQFLCENGSGWSPEDISVLSEDGTSGLSVEHTTNVLTWAELLGLAYRGPDGLRVDPGVKHVLSME